MPTLQTLIAFFGVAVVLALTPGPDNIFVLLQSAQRGWRAGMAVVLGLRNACCFELRDNCFHLLRMAGVCHQDRIGGVDDQQIACAQRYNRAVWCMDEGVMRRDGVALAVHPVAEDG